MDYAAAVMAVRRLTERLRRDKSLARVAREAEEALCKGTN